MDKERNKHIYEEYRKGKSLGEIGRMYNLTTERIRQIVNKEKAKSVDTYWVDKFPQKDRRILIENRITNEREFHEALESGKLVLSKRSIATCNMHLKDPVVRERKPHPKFIDLTGEKFGRLTVIERGETKGGVTTWKCRCKCGNVVTVRRDYLVYGRTRSCGCWKKDRFKLIHEIMRNALNGAAFNIPSMDDFDSEVSK